MTWRRVDALPLVFAMILAGLEREARALTAHANILAGDAEALTFHRRHLLPVSTRIALIHRARG